MVSQPFFSVIITTYNRAKLLDNALRSLILQTYPNWEAIIVDDESTDGTHSRILPYLIKYDNIRYLRKIHSGSPMSKNTGICSSTGKYITFLDSDDEYDPEHLESRRKILQLKPSVKFLHGGVKIIGSRFVPDRFENNKLVDLKDCVIGGTFFIDRNTLFKLRGFRKILLGEDADLFDRAVNSAIRMEKTDLPTYIYHHDTEDSITNKLYNESIISK